jgi:integrase
MRLKVKHIDSAQKIIRIEQSKGRKDPNVMLLPETLDLLRHWGKSRIITWDDLGRGNPLLRLVEDITFGWPEPATLKMKPGH